MQMPPDLFSIGKIGAAQEAVFTLRIIPSDSILLRTSPTLNRMEYGTFLARWYVGSLSTVSLIRSPLYQPKLPSNKFWYGAVFT